MMGNCTMIRGVLWYGNFTVIRGVLWWGIVKCSGGWYGKLYSHRGCVMVGNCTMIRVSYGRQLYSDQGGVVMRNCTVIRGLLW
jgi:hypothetical protein